MVLCSLRDTELAYCGLLNQGRRNVFSFGGGGGGQKGHYNVKKGTNDAHADNITNVLMMHPCIDIRFLFICLAYF